MRLCMGEYSAIIFFHLFSDAVMHALPLFANRQTPF